MAYVMKKNVLKSGDTIFSINSVSRIPGTARQKSLLVEKYSRNALLSEGKDPEAFMEARLKELREKSRHERPTLTYTIDLTLPLQLSDDGGELKVSDSLRNLGFIPYARIYHMLGLDDLINNRRRYTEDEGNVNAMFRRLLCSGILYPSPRRREEEGGRRFWDNEEYALPDLCRSLDSVMRWRKEILLQSDKAIRKEFGREDTVIFSLLLNVPSGEKGEEESLRLGLFLDERGLPLTYELFRESATMSEALEERVIDLSGKRGIIVADKAMTRRGDRGRIREAGNGYVIGESLRESDGETRAFALAEEGWKKSEETGRTTFMIKERTVTGTDGTEGERQIFLRSGKAGEKRDGISVISTNVIGVDSEDKPSHFASWRDSDGFLVLNHLVPPSEIADIYSDLRRMEETFTVTKTDMAYLRPTFPGEDERLRAHFFLKFLSLQLERILSLLLKSRYSEKTIRNSLSNFTADLLPSSNVYLITSCDEVARDALKAVGMEKPRQFLLRKDIERIIGETERDSD